MPQFMLLLHEDPKEFAGLGQAEFMGVIQQYQAWGQKMASEGKLVGR